jgi:hypothetical protein
MLGTAYLGALRHAQMLQVGELSHPRQLMAAQLPACLAPNVQLCQLRQVAQAWQLARLQVLQVADVQ